ncbi:DENN domain-containing protein 2D isoform X1 [Pleuronectes platessa]|uniref:DENN domain-containing protein 2D isoform X1 n=1 Tax=Pleuronectes platessa TaxID=8262 RepID=UPI00232A264C|nr:DENN domain-containing protein 2D isoform X1 [Pleuronectes platessa]
MEKTSQQAQVNAEQQLLPNTRRSFSFSSLRIKKRHNSEEEGGFRRRRGLLLFSSVRESSRKESVFGGDGASQPRGSQDQVKKTERHNSEEEGGFRRRRGLPSFSSVRESSRKESVSDGDGASQPCGSQDQVKKTGEQPIGNLISDVAGNHGPIPSGEDEGGRQGALKRFSAMWSSFRRGKKDRSKDQEPAEPLGQAVEPNTSRQQRYLSGQYFFEYLVVVSLKKNKDGSNYEPQITYQFPKRDGMARSQKEEEEKTLQAITLFCFPEGINWAPLTEYHSETFSFVLTEVDGSRRNGYCRRLLPGGKGARPPEAYCIISSLACFGLFSKIFDEVEKRRQISMAMIYPFMQKLREAPFPAPGNTVEIKSFIPESGTEIISLTRPLDSWLEHVNFAKLFDCLTDDEVLLVFAAAVLERRIIFIADDLGTLSQVIHAVAALLYPFTWQHTLISIVPKILIDVVMAPTPYLLGVQKRLLDQVDDQGDLMVDLSEDKKKTFIFSTGDEASILPPKLQTEILEALSKRQEASTAEELNRVVSEAFLHFFVKTVGHYSSYVKYSRGAQGVFEKRSFYKAIESKTTRHFVKKFIQTQMFDLFIQEVEQQPGPQQGIFHKKILEYEEKKKRDKARKH